MYIHICVHIYINILRYLFICTYLYMYQGTFSAVEEDSHRRCRMCVGCSVMVFKGCWC